MAVLVGVKGRLLVVLTCISLVTDDVEPRFVCLLAIGESSGKKCPFLIICPFKWSHLSFYCLCLKAFFAQSGCRCLFRYMIFKWFLPSHGLSFRGLDDVLETRIFSVGSKFSVSVVTSVIRGFGVASKMNTTSTALRTQLPIHMTAVVKSEALKTPLCVLRASQSWLLCVGL